MCNKFGKSPCDYMWNDLECTHTQLAIDMTIFNIWSSWKREEQDKQERKLRLQNAAK